MAAAAALALGCVSAAQAETLRIGVEGAYPPFSSITPSGELVGFDIDIAKALCEEMAVECTLVDQDWDGIIPALLARRYDAIIASMSITEERKQVVDFTDKYYHTPAAFVARDGDEFDFDGGLDGVRVGVQRATTHDTYVTDNFPQAQVVRYGTQEEANLDLVAGRIDMMLADSIALDEGFLKTDAGQGFDFTGPRPTDPRWFGEGAGIAVRKGEDDLRERLNAAIVAIRESGVYEEIQGRYFDFDVYGDD